MRLTGVEEHAAGSGTAGIAGEPGLSSLKLPTLIISVSRSRQHLLCPSTSRHSREPQTEAGTPAGSPTIRVMHEEQLR